MPVLSDLIDYYTNLLIIQYNNKPNARATIDLIGEILLASNIFYGVRDGYDIDTAVGAQLDVLGKYADIERFYYSYEFVDDYFGFADASNVGAVSSNIIGFDDAVSLNKTGEFLDSTDVISNELVLNDDAFRILLKLRIVQNNSNHSINAISGSLFSFFGGDIIIKDNYNMTMTYFFGDDVSPVLAASRQKKVLPKPAAVGLEALAGQSFFSMADATNLDAIAVYMVGFNDATAGLIKNGKFLNENSDIL